MLRFCFCLSDKHNSDESLSLLFINWTSLWLMRISSSGVTPEMEILMQRRIYPFLLMVVSLIGILSFQIRQFKRLYEHIKNDK